MKIAISSNSEKIDSLIDQRFGRCPFFLIIDTSNNLENFEVIKNEGAILGHAAGIKAAEQIGELEVNAVITGQLGPNATKILNELNIKAYSASGKVSDAINDFKNNTLKEITKIANPHNEDSKINIKEKSDEKIFFPLLNNDGLNSKISQHFGHAPFFGLYDVNKSDLKIIKNDLDHTNPNKSPIDQIQDAVNPTTIFAKGIGGRAIDIIQKKGLKLKTGNYDSVKEVVENIDSLETLTDSCGHEH
jgi:predicted Fe-Mo cluster-binding NifX family protein